MAVFLYLQAVSPVLTSFAVFQAHRVGTTRLIISTFDNGVVKEILMESYKPVDTSNWTVHNW